MIAAAQTTAAALTPLPNDWFRLASWNPIWEAKRIAPTAVPGVQQAPFGASKKPPYPYLVHRTHLPILGIPVPEATGLIRGVSGSCRGVVLRPHQIEGINYIRSRRGTLLADEMRVGKSPQIMYSHDPDAGPLAMLGPLAARSVWHEWAARRFGACLSVHLKQKCLICARVGAELQERPSFVALEGRTYKPELMTDYRPQVMFATFAVASTWRQMFAHVNRLGTLGIDEAHLAGVQKRDNITVESVRWFNTIAARTIMATGTPIFNKLKGMWPILDICNPGAWGSFWDFATRYLEAKPGAHGWTADGEANVPEFRQRLSEVMIRRRWIDIAKNLPPIQRTVEVVELPQRVRDEVDEVAARVRFETGGIKTMVGDMARIRRLYAKAKASASLPLIGRTLDDGYTLVVWTWHKDVAEQLYQTLSVGGRQVFGPITGDVTGARREDILERVTQATGPRVLIANIASLSTAVSTAWATHEIFVELDWSPVNISQAEMRPFDGTHPVAVTYMVADVDNDQQLANALIAKLETQDAIGLRGGLGDVAEVLGGVFGIEKERTLEELAQRLIDTMEDYV